MRGNWIAAVLVLAGVSTTACVPIRNMVADRDLVCRDVPDELCVRIADVGLAALDLEQAELDVGRISTLQVYPEPCPDPGPRPGARCWTLEATNEHGGVGVPVYGWPDGSLLTIVGN